MCFNVHLIKYIYLILDLQVGGSEVEPKHWDHRGDMGKGDGQSGQAEEQAEEEQG